MRGHDRYGGPALILWGQHDSLAPRAHTEAYSTGFKNGRLEVLKNSRHSLYAEAPEPAAQIIQHFLTDD
ncbi:MAG: alpha/beta hydrolase [Pseudomonadota bacterium]|nr:alpha/beta hydrolase [Pseudomonadota bacterium]